MENEIAAAVASDIGEHVADIVEEVRDEADHAREVAKEIVGSVREGETFREIEEIKRSVEEWQSIISDQSEAIQGLTMGLVSVSAKLDLLTPTQLVTPPLPSVEDGPKESLVETPTVITVEAEAPPTEPPAPPAPKKKRHNWI